MYSTINSTMFILLFVRLTLLVVTVDGDSTSHHSGNHDNAHATRHHGHHQSGGNHHVQSTGVEATEQDAYSPVRFDVEILGTADASLCPWDFVVATVTLPTTVHPGRDRRPTYRPVVLYEARLMTGGCGQGNCTNRCSQLGSEFACEAVHYSLPVRHDFSVRLTVGFTCAHQ